MPETSQQKLSPAAKIVPHPTVARGSHRMQPRPGFLKRVRDRWLECWRLSALTAPGREHIPGLPQTVPSFGAIPDPTGEYTPKAGQRGKNVQWVPSSPVVLDKMLDMAGVTAGDYVVDPGSGDGRIAIRAAKRGARTLGVEFNPRLVALAQRNAMAEGVSDRTDFRVDDFFGMDFTGATVVTLFLRKDLNMKLRPKLLALPPGTRIVSNIFDMGDWEADETVKVEDGDYYFRNHTVRLWRVPARAEGLWALPNGRLELKQKYQMLTGALDTGAGTAPLDGRITGACIRFTAAGRRYIGRVTGGRMVLEADDGSNIRWIATLES